MGPQASGGQVSVGLFFWGVPSFVLGWISFWGICRGQTCADFEEATIQLAKSATKQLSPISPLLISNITPPQHLGYVYLSTHTYIHTYIYVAAKGRGVFRIHTPQDGIL